MKKKYRDILEKALPYYKIGRPGDLEHITWIANVIPKYVDELDLDILIPLAILHDVGYAKVARNTDPFNLDVRRAHMKEGAKLAKKILEELNYPKEKVAEIVRLIAKHDDWAFGETFTDEPLLLAFNNFDFMWMASKKGFNIVRKFTNQEPKQFYKQIVQFQKEMIQQGRNWFNKNIENFYKELMKERRLELVVKK